MNPSAKVLSIDAIEQYRASYCELIKAARAALDAMRMDVRRFQRWLEHEQVEFWKLEMKRAERELADAKSALMRKQISNAGNESKPCSEERAAVRKAENRIRHIEDKLRAIKRWVPAVEQAVQKYEGSARQLANMLDVDAKNGLALIDRALNALDAYLRTTTASGPPSTPATPPVAE